MPAMKVLIAEDSAPIRERLRGLLGELDGLRNIDEARDGLEAVNSIRDLKPDVLILDIRLPKLNGISVLKSINQGELHPIVIVLTNYAYPQYRAKCIEEGAHFFFDKTTEFHKIPQVLERLIRRSNSWQDCCLFE